MTEFDNTNWADIGRLRQALAHCPQEENQQIASQIVPDDGIDLSGVFASFQQLIAPPSQANHFGNPFPEAGELTGLFFPDERRSKNTVYIRRRPTNLPIRAIPLILSCVTSPSLTMVGKRSTCKLFARISLFCIKKCTGRI